VDVLAANAAKALGSLWGGLNSVAKSLGTKVEAAAKEVAKELAVGLEEGAAGGGVRTRVHGCVRDPHALRGAAL
jgi:hypothetical protein